MSAGKKILIGFAVPVGIVILFGAIGNASQDKPRSEADICTSGYDALDADLFVRRNARLSIMARRSWMRGRKTMEERR